MYRCSFAFSNRVGDSHPTPTPMEIQGGNPEKLPPPRGRSALKINIRRAVPVCSQTTTVPVCSNGVLHCCRNAPKTTYPPGVGVQGGKYSHPTIFRGVGIPPQIAKSHPPGVGENIYTDPESAVVLFYLARLQVWWIFRISCHLS